MRVIPNSREIVISSVRVETASSQPGEARPGPAQPSPLASAVSKVKWLMYFMVRGPQVIFISQQRGKGREEKGSREEKGRLRTAMALCDAYRQHIATSAINNRGEKTRICPALPCKVGWGWGENCTLPA